MITETRNIVSAHRILATVLLLLLGTGVFCGILSLIGYVGYAHAQGSGFGVIPPPPPVDDGSALLSFLQSGQWLPAIGAGLTIVAGIARAGLVKLSAWFGTTLGGFVVAWGTTALLYVGGALEQGQTPTLQLLACAFAAGLLVSGILTHYAAITAGLAAMRARAKTVVTKTLVLSVLGGLVSGVVFSCATVTPAAKCEVSAVEQIVVTNGSGDVTIVGDLVSAIASGGATLPTLLDQLGKEFGPATLNCAMELADDIASSLENLFAPSAPTIASTIQAGLVVHHAEMDKRHLKHR